ncbi:hypothetical protein YC2023_007138 [Brassica napus]
MWIVKVCHMKHNHGISCQDRTNLLIFELEIYLPVLTSPSCYGSEIPQTLELIGTLPVDIKLLKLEGKIVEEASFFDVLASLLFSGIDSEFVSHWLF